MSDLASILTMFLFPERTMWRFGSLTIEWSSFFSSLWFHRHVFHIEHLTHVCSKDEWFVFELTIVKVHGCHPILLVDCYHWRTQGEGWGGCSPPLGLKNFLTDFLFSKRLHIFGIFLCLFYESLLLSILNQY